MAKLAKTQSLEKQIIIISTVACNDNIFGCLAHAHSHVHNKPLRIAGKIRGVIKIFSKLHFSDFEGAFFVDHSQELNPNNRCSYKELLFFKSFYHPNVMKNISLAFFFRERFQSWFELLQSDIHVHFLSSFYPHIILLEDGRRQPEYIRDKKINVPFFRGTFAIEYGKPNVTLK